MTETDVTTTTTPTQTSAVPQGTVDMAKLRLLASKSQQDIAALLEGADFVTGRALVDKASLTGEPFIITSVTFRKGYMDLNKVQHDYVSCEYTSLEDLPIDAVFNDGSTGIRRQVVQYLASKGLLPEHYVENPDTTVWGVLPAAVDENGEGSDWEIPVKLVCARGLRVSEYSNEFTDEGVTFYLA